MSSINFNSSAEIALQTLRNVNDDLARVNNSVSTGRDINSARDNAAIWSISNTMESDIESNDAVLDALALGDSTVEVARTGAEEIVDLLTDVQTLVISAESKSASDRETIQRDIDQLLEQIDSIIASSSFNGVNLLDGSSTEYSMLSSINRSADGSVSTQTIDVDAQNLTRTVDTPGAELSGSDNNVVVDDTTDLANDGSATNTIEIDFDSGGAAADFAAGSEVTYSFSVNGNDYSLEYTTQAGDDINDVINELESQWDAIAVKPANFDLAFNDASTDANGVINGNGSIVASNTDPGSNTAPVATGFDLEILAPGTSTGGLSAVSNLDVINGDLTAALAAVDEALVAARDSAASLGSSQNRIDNQESYIMDLMTSLESGVSSLVDTDMEAASAELTALQTQQELNIQSLTIASTSSASILALFQ